MDEEQKEQPKAEPGPRRISLPGWMVNEEVGLGDALERAIYRVGIRPRGCAGCKQRAAALNRRVVLSPR
jgi:hypothetical protein